MMVKRNGGAAVPSDDNNKKWYTALNELTPGIDGVSREDIKRSRTISKMVVG